MVLPDIPLYYRESSEPDRSSRFCLRPVHTIQPRGEKRADAINVQLVRGKTTTFVHLDEDEAARVQQHGDAVLRKVQRVHKSAVWSFVVGRSFADRAQGRGKAGSDELDLDRDEGAEFDPDNPRTWSDESLAFVRSLLRARRKVAASRILVFRS